MKNILDKKKVVIVDDHPIVKKGLVQLINKQKDLTVIKTASGSHEALKILETENPDLMIVDITLKDSNGIDLIKDINIMDKNIAVLVLSMHDESVYAERAIKAGAKGYIMKQSVTKNLLKAIYTVLKGNIYLSDDISSKLLDKTIKNKTGDNSIPDVITLLSDRELEVLEFTGQGLTTEEIAEKMCLGLKTIETYKTKIKDKLNLKNFNQLIKFAVEWSILHKK